MDNMYEFQKEVKKQISEKEAKKHDNFVNFEAIAKLKREGKKIKPVLMKNYYVAFVVTSPLWNYYEKGDIDSDLFYAGLKYSSDYLTSIRDNRAKQVFDIVSGGFSYKNNKEPSQRQIESSGRIQKIRQLLDQESKYIKPCKHFKDSKKNYKISKTSVYGNKHYREIIKLFLEEEINMKDTKDKNGNITKRGMKSILAIRHETIKERIIESLGIINEFYKDTKSKNR